MAEEKTLDSKIEKEMASIAGLFSIMKDYDHAQKPSELASLEESAIQIMLQGRDPKDPNIQSDLEFLRKEFDAHPKDAYKKISSGLAQRIGEIKADYQSNQEVIYQRIEAKLNEELASAKNKLDAVNILLKYFSAALERPDIKQEDADKIVLMDFVNRTKMPHISKEHPNIGDTDYAVLSLYRRELANYLAEGEDKKEKKTVYRIDSDKLSEFVKDPVMGSAIYTALHAPKKKAKAAA